MDQVWNGEKLIAVERRKVNFAGETTIVDIFDSRTANILEAWRSFQWLWEEIHANSFRDIFEHMK